MLKRDLSRGWVVSDGIRGASEPLRPHVGAPAEDPPVLVVSPGRADTIPLLREMLRGEPEITIVVDRRSGGERRSIDLAVEIEPAEDALPERRRGDRRRRVSYYLL